MRETKEAYRDMWGRRWDAWKEEMEEKIEMLTIKVDKIGKQEEEKSVERESVSYATGDRGSRISESRDNS